jgi:uncharacterized protein
LIFLLIFVQNIGMIYRKIVKEFQKWKDSKVRKPLVLRGARQVGKSTVVRELGKTYTNFIELNLEKSNDAKFFISYGDNVNTIVQAILLEYNLRYDLENTLLFIDEIQASPQAIGLLRYFYEELPALHVIAAGSLLEFALGDVKSFPVGRVQQMAVHPLDFEEFLMAMGEEVALTYYNTIPVPQVAVQKLIKLFNQYIIVGGMPEVVNYYMNNGRNLSELSIIYSSIWDNYLDDIDKYGHDNKEKAILRHIIATAPLVRDRITFNGFGNSQYGSREVGEAFRKLHKAGLIRLIYPSNELSPPISTNLKRKPKIQILDTGLLNFASNIQAQMLGVEDLNHLYKGYLVNHAVFQEVIAQHTRINQLPHFWTRENANANAEVDMIVQHKNQIFPIEIKSGASGRLRSLMEFVDRADHNIGFRLLAHDVVIENIATIQGKPFRLVNLPYFCAAKIEEYVEWVLRSQ